jgi:RHS repeat-associated protein
VIKHVTYDAFGNVTSDSAPTVGSLFLYTARPFDADSALQNNLFRWYDPAIGRWMGEDPIAYKGGHANLYAYASNTPSGRIDPFGLSPAICKCCPKGYVRAPWKHWDDAGPTGKVEWRTVTSNTYNVSFSWSKVKKTSSGWTVSAGLSGSWKELGLSASYSGTYSSESAAKAAVTKSFSFQYKVERKFEEHKLFVTEFATYCTKVFLGAMGAYPCDPGDVNLGIIDCGYRGIVRLSCRRCGKVSTLRRVSPAEFIKVLHVPTPEHRLTGDITGTGNSAKALATYAESAAQAAAQTWFTLL